MLLVDCGQRKLVDLGNALSARNCNLSPLLQPLLTESVPRVQKSLSIQNQGASEKGEVTGATCPRPRVEIDTQMKGPDVGLLHKGC